MRIIAFITSRPSIKPILDSLGEPASPPPISPARGLPRWEGFDPPEGAYPVLSDTPPSMSSSSGRSGKRLPTSSGFCWSLDLDRHRRALGQAPDTDP